MSIIQFSLLISLLIIFSGCGVSKSSLGFGKKSPNEYSLLKQKPLVVPPHFDLPEPKKTVTSTPVSEEEFDQIFYGNKAPSTKIQKNKLSSSDKKFLKKTKSYHKKKNIKKVIASENKPSAKDTKNKQSFLGKLLNR